jgi:BirA family biotin operon repressor/biotin-[acetyl-CoA-carboxylase] ligase
MAPLAHAGDIFTAAAVKIICAQSGRCDIECYKTLSSTNTLLKQKAEAGEKEGKVAIAETQSGGKGRLGRSFFSPMGTGIYMSILLRPQLEMENAVLITTLAAVCVAQAVENVTDKQTGIKWVNDIYYNGKKICGILTEAGCDCENGRLNYAVLGIGIKVYGRQTGFQKSLMISQHACTMGKRQAYARGSQPKSSIYFSKNTAILRRRIFWTITAGA